MSGAKPGPSLGTTARGGNRPISTAWTTAESGDQDPGEELAQFIHVAVQLQGGPDGLLGHDLGHDAVVQVIGPEIPKLRPSAK